MMHHRITRLITAAAEWRGDDRSRNQHLMRGLLRRPVILGKKLWRMSSEALEEQQRREFASAVEEWRAEKAAGRGEAVIVEAGGGFAKKEPILLFDLDGTLYPIDCGYIEESRENIFNYMTEKGFAKSPENAKEIWWPLFRKYNQSIRGLRAGGYQINEGEYWDYVRRGMEKYFSKDDNLRNLLTSIEVDKYIFTNCHEIQAGQLLEILGIKDCFKGIFGAGFMGEHCKPEKEVFLKVFDALDADASQLTLFEDSYKNLVTAKSLGMSTVFIESKLTAEEEGVTKAQKEAVSCCVQSLSDPQARSQLLTALPQVFKSKEK